MDWDIAVFVVWMIVGFLVLISKRMSISKLEYGLTWGVLILQLFHNIILNL